MKTDTREKILSIISKTGRARPSELKRELGLSNVAIHRQLSKLIAEGSLEKFGKPPIIFYAPTFPFIPTEVSGLHPADISFIEKRYSYITPTGFILTGLKGFVFWVHQIKQIKFLKQLTAEYVKTRKEADRHFSSSGTIDATEKIQRTFPDSFFLDKVLFQDFYALPKFGKTRLGQLVLHAKQAQHKELIDQIADEVKPILEKIIHQHAITAVGFIPHSIPRKLPFLKEFRQYLRLHLPEVELVKAYAGEIPVAQKSLGKLEERIQNAKETIFLKQESNRHKSVLLIDDAVGSGATLNETAQKLKKNFGVKTVIGFAIVGSMKGFDVIREV